MNNYTIFHARNGNRLKQYDGRQEMGRPYLIYATQLVSFRNAIEAIKEIVFQEQIWPDQCDYVIYTMSPIKKTATQIANSMKKRGARSAVHNRYTLLVSAYSFADQVDILIDCVREYRETADHRNTKKSKQKLIASSLQSLESCLGEFTRELYNSMPNSRPV